MGRGRFELAEELLIRRAHVGGDCVVGHPGPQPIQLATSLGSIGLRPFGLELTGLGLTSGLHHGGLLAPDVLINGGQSCHHRGLTALECIDL